MTIEEELIRHSERIGELTKKNIVLRKALEQIRDEDVLSARYKANVRFIVRKALEETE